jgi:hypothetical protein
MGMYTNILSFKGTFRKYQQRVLDNSVTYLEDKRFHIVAAPGSGKTTLGIEIIRRLDESCLILSPSITIRQQWMERIIKGFLNDGIEADAWISTSLKEPKPMLSITYQALHSCFEKYKGTIKDQDEEEEVDYTNIDIYEIIEKQNIKILCLDEAHHLRNEWWEALEKLVKRFPKLTIISLTATPPYDSSPSLWKRYIDLCGPVDEEISTPELVQEGSLCPHQDYVYFNYPTKEEIAVINDYQVSVNTCVKILCEYQSFINAVKTHPGLQNPQMYADTFLEKPEYLVSILIFLNYQKIEYPSYFNELLDTKKRYLPLLSNHWLEILLQGFLYEDTKSYTILEEDYDFILQTLKKHGCIQKKKVTLVTNDKISKMLLSSKGKLLSIKEIVKEEYQSLNTELRLLILCDYIKKETVSLVGSTTPINEIGAIPIFEMIRREEIKGIKLGVLSGGIVLLPNACEALLMEKLGLMSASATMMPLPNSDYSVVNHNVNNGDIVRIVTEIFQEGHINTLIGTKSLLGEGWDSPYINALILASFVGSFMLSNQMRGRAIRTLASQPNKVSNIWHLVCLDPPMTKKIFKDDGTLDDQRGGYDIALLKRRFEAFLGLHYEENIVENGIERLCIKKIPTNIKGVDDLNEQMLKRANDRPTLLQRWKSTLQIIGKSFEIEQVNEVDPELLKPSYLFINLLTFFAISTILSVLYIILVISFRTAIIYQSGNILVVGVIGMILFILVTRFGVRLYTLLTPEKRLQKIGETLLQTLRYMGEVSTINCAVKTEKISVSEDGDTTNTFVTQVYIKGATMREKTLFSISLNEVFDVIDNPRYLCIATKEKLRINKYYVIPEIIGKRKDSAEYFVKQLTKVMGPCKLIYTRTPEGRKILLEARTRSFGYKNIKKLGNKKIVKGKYE